MGEQPDGSVIRIDLTPAQARQLIARMQQALILGPQVGSPN